MCSKPKMPKPVEQIVYQEAKEPDRYLDSSTSKRGRRGTILTQDQGSFADNIGGKKTLLGG